jgi:hypothetical protein
MIMKKIWGCLLLISAGMAYAPDNSLEVALRLCFTISQQKVHRVLAADAAIEVCMVIEKNPDAVPRDHAIVDLFDAWKDSLRTYPLEMEQVNYKAGVVCSVLSVSSEVSPVLQSVIMKWKEKEAHCKVLDLAVAHVSALHLAECLKHVQ